MDDESGTKTIGLACLVTIRSKSLESDKRRESIGLERISWATNAFPNMNSSGRRDDPI